MLLFSYLEESVCKHLLRLLFCQNKRVKFKCLNKSHASCLNFWHLDSKTVLIELAYIKMEILRRAHSKQVVILKSYGNFSRSAVITPLNYSVTVKLSL